MHENDNLEHSKRKRVHLHADAPKQSPRGFDLVLTMSNPSQMGERRDNADCSVATHPQVPNVVEEDHGCRGLRIDRFAKKRADDHFRSAGFTNHSSPEGVEFVLGGDSGDLADLLFRDQARGNNNARRLPFSMRVNDLYPALFHYASYRIYIVYDFEYIYVAGV